MSKFILIILLILSFYIYTSITPTSRGDINHNVALIPHHIGNVVESVAEIMSLVNVGIAPKRGVCYD